MDIKGVVYVPEDGTHGWQREGPGVHTVANRPLTGIILQELADAGVDSLAVVAPSDRLEELRACLAADAARGLDVSFVDLASPHGLAGALNAVTAFVGDDAVIVHLATGLLGQSCEPLVADAAEQGEDLRLLLHRSREGGGSLSATTTRLLGVGELGSPAGRLSLAGLAVFSPGAFARAAHSPVCSRAHTEHATGAEPTHELITIADELAAEGLTIGAGIVTGWCEYSADPRALLELNRAVLDRQAMSVHHHAAAAGNRIEGRVVIHETAEVSASVILGPSLIGPGARIADAYIGPYTTIGAGAVIENCEILRSIIGPGARITHVAGRIEGSTIGRDANIFRDFRLPRAMRLHVGEGVEVAFN
jgi:glucose-1-phosphate thymidylyltransferase